jgi:hypothetical protein
MNETIKRPFQRFLPGVLALSLLISVPAPQAKADVHVDTLLGAAGGAIIGGIADGSKGARRGAWIGGGVGLGHGLYRVHWRDSYDWRDPYGYRHGSDYRYNQRAYHRRAVERERQLARQHMLEMEMELQRTRAQLERTEAQLAMHRQTIATKPVVPGGYETAPTFSEAAVIFEIQRTLAAKGYPTGPASGMLDPATVEAIKLYQEDNALDITGAPSKPLLEFMKR